MNDNVSFDNGQLFLNLAMPIDVKVDGTVESLKRLIWSLDYSGFGRSGKKKAGRPSAIEPQRMMTIIVYGYMNGQTSSRELEWFCGTNLVCQHLLGTARVPDHATFDRFIRGNHDAIAGILAGMLYRKTKNFYVPAIVNSMFFTWMAVATDLIFIGA